jgi:N-acetylglucosamine repressor
MRKIDTRNFRRATRSSLRDVNRQIVLNLIREHQPISRAELARRMAVARSALTVVVRSLISEGMIFEGAAGRTERGRRPTLLYVRTRDRLVAAVDVRITRTVLTIADIAGRQVALESFETPATPAALVAELGTRLRRLIDDNDAAGSCVGVGLVVPGVVDRRTRRVLFSPQLGWRDADIAEPLAGQLGLPVTVENAPVACALAHVWLGSGAGGAAPAAAGNFAYVAVSDGVGVGSVVNGEVLRGHRDTVGEFGHVTLSMDGARCRCGARGCWEAYTSNVATLSRYLDIDLTQRDRAGRPTAVLALGMEELIARARRGDARAVWALQETGRYLGVGLANVVHALGPERIVVGGEIADAWDIIEPPLREALAARALTQAAAQTVITCEPPGSGPRLRGAVAVVAAPTFAAPQLG